MNNKEKELVRIENDAFYLEWEYKVDKAHTAEYYREQIDRLNNLINALRVEVYGTENLEDSRCQCGLYHVKETYFLQTYYRKKN